MVDLSGMPPAFMGNMTFHGVTDPSANKVNAIKESNAGNSLSGNTSSDQSRNLYDRKGRSIQDTEAANKDRPLKRADDNAHPGPPPSFNISILEVERDLAQVLARMNAEKSLPSDVEAVSANRGKDSAEASQDSASQAALNAKATEAPAQANEAPQRAERATPADRAPDQTAKSDPSSETAAASAEQGAQRPETPALAEDQ